MGTNKTTEQKEPEDNPFGPANAGQQAEDDPIDPEHDPNCPALAKDIIAMEKSFI